MSYKIGQFSRGRLTLDSYKSDINFVYKDMFGEKYIENQKVGGSSYGTPVLTPTATLGLGKSYYLKFTIVKENGVNLDWNFTIKAHSSGGLNQQIKKITFVGSETHNTATYEFIFTPKINVSAIHFEIERNADDENLTYEGGYVGKYANVIIQNFHIVENILQYESVGLPSVINKLEVKSMSGLLMAINGEEIRVGRRNIYELNYDKIKVTSLGFVLKPSKYYLDGYDYFTMNYQYEEDEE